MSREITPLHFGIDTLILNFKTSRSDFDSLIQGTSTNSSFRLLERFKGQTFNINVTFSDVQKYATLMQDSLPVIYITYYTERIDCEDFVKYQVCFYGSYFIKNPEMTILKELLKDCYSLSRLDLCLDLPVSVNRAVNNFSTKLRKKSKFSNGKRLETQYIGAKKNNKRYFMRVYDKLLDSQTKAKINLYKDYFNYDNVSRIELEIKRVTLEGYKVTPKKLLNDLNNDMSYCKEIFTTLSYNRQCIYLPILRHVNLEKVILGRSSTKNANIDRLSYSKTFLGYARGLQEMGFDPVDFLQKNL